jgi:hypothetical protein
LWDNYIEQEAASQYEDVEDDAEEEDDPPQQVPCDENGTELPSQAIAAFNMLPDLRVFLRALDQAAKKCEEVGKSPLGIHMH